MQIITISPRGFGANTYAITLDNKSAIVIDPSGSHVESALIKRGLTAEYVLLTHCHFDHVGGAFALQQAGARVVCSDKEKPLVGTNADLFELFGAPRPPFSVDETMSDGEERTFAGLRVRLLLTPGHTKGSASYLITDEDGKKHLFSGDTLFAGSIGRTDFPTGSISDMRASLKKLASLDGDMPVYAGHNEETSLDHERKTNPFMADA